MNFSPSCIKRCLIGLEETWFPCNFNVATFCEENNLGFIGLEYNIGQSLDVEWEMLLRVIYKENRDAFERRTL